MSRYEQKKSNQYTIVLMILLIIFLIVVALWKHQSNQVQDFRAIKSLDIPIEKTVSVVEKEIQLPEGVIDNTLRLETDQQILHVEDLDIKSELVSLENSDDGFRDAVGDVSEGLVDWFNVINVIEKYLVVINDVSQNQISYKHRAFIKAPGSIVVKEDSEGLYLAQESYKRYDGLANAIASIDVQKGFALYLKFKPVFKAVYQNFAYPAGYELEDIFMKAAASVIEAPVIESRLALVQHTVKYKFAEKKLETLNDVEKQMLRMGPENTKKIQAKLRQLVEAISVLNN